MHYDIQMADVTIEFALKSKRVSAVDQVNVTFKAGKITGVIGETGSGKSVLGMSILQLLPKQACISGTCFFGHKDLYALDAESMRKIRGQEIGLIVQNPNEALNPVRTIGRQLMEPLIKHFDVSRTEARKTVEAHLRCFGFEMPKKVMQQYTFQMSGGMNQRLIAIMGLICHPSWLIADEPTKGLDAILRRSIYDVFWEIRQHYTQSMIVITHDLFFAKKLCEQIVVMYQGEIVEIGEAKKVLTTPLHPYTKGLLMATPKAGMTPIPDHLNPSHESRCKFYSRCQFASAKCKVQFVELREIDPDTMVRCILYD
ncbi:ABC transporter ATP-binding protein [Fusibacter paucivorans]|uniref:Nickel import system ATP-binding protein NikD n=1 Tax=Fusibacter paucivorans TaxID=76009 RepID=A0ABS5PRS6_9FIRM|nr:ABC transporter ATP-binding protein [Fusibacter paucivorans]MBS7527865.1 ABC transporter ATP-binding protein [Fusibacter paucivorans]